MNSWEECVAQCCRFSRCNVAYYLSSTCLHIECLSDELCEPTDTFNNNINEETLYLKVRSIRKLRKTFLLNIEMFVFFLTMKETTAAAMDFDDPGTDQCNQTNPCSLNEQCQQVEINAQLKRRMCLCDLEKNYRRINGK